MLYACRQAPLEPKSVCLCVCLPAHISAANPDHMDFKSSLLVDFIDKHLGLRLI